MTSSNGVPVGFSMLSKMNDKWDRDFVRIQNNNSEYRRYTGKGGVQIPAIITKIWPRKDNPGVFSRGFECYVLHAQGAETANEKALKTPDVLTIPVRYNPKDGAPVLPPDFIANPTETVIYSRAIRHFSTPDMDSLDILLLGQVVVLESVSARCWLSDKPTDHWEVSLDVGHIRPAHGLSLAGLWPVARGTQTDVLRRNTKPYIEEIESTRYCRSHTHMLSIWAPRSDKASIEEGRVRFAREKGNTRLENKSWTAKTWMLESPSQGRAPTMRAALEFGHIQATVSGEDISKEVALVNMVLYSEHLREFGIVDLKAWEVLAPLIFNNLDFKVFGYVDTKGSVINYGGVDASKKIDFALTLFCMGIIPDLGGCYTNIGIPVTADFVIDQQMKPGNAPSSSGMMLGASMNVGTKEFFSSLPDVVPVTGGAADPVVSREILRIANDDAAEKKPTFRAIVNYNRSPAVTKGLASISPEQGASLLTAIQENNEAIVESDDVLANLFSMMASAHTLSIVVFAMCEHMIPDNVRMRRNKDLIAYMAGRNAEGTLSLNAPSSVSESTSASASASASASSDPRVNKGQIEEIDDPIADPEDEAAEESTPAPEAEAEGEAQAEKTRSPKRTSTKDSKRRLKKSRG